MCFLKNEYNLNIRIVAIGGFHHCFGESYSGRTEIAMKKYIFNSEYVIDENENMSIVFSSDVEYVYVLQDIELRILKTFFKEKNIDEAVAEIGAFFSSESYRREECAEFINKLIEEGILIDAQD